ncbi:hypothetical protein G8J22_00634 [Lentilactobacillus hilgardii]|uniref:leucine-rich repeat protein n=1 Tax=Lentilactobacillus hilgardii TaxID=1588 RepID=UPI00019C4B18|nr:leucine-rich repeat protein [Lentilactobacillus hilgardii]EEI20213.1 MucBP domain protein [Lentilactobacillus buchneri ATCC 11577]MCT3396319.1 hypothetical protein [Lentilactobacillus hilgardii]QIR08700.1 hypothetical protein G8J22_00634 [Lentilactobacillus hilgardii]
MKNFKLTAAALGLVLGLGASVNVDNGLFEQPARAETVSTAKTVQKTFNDQTDFDWTYNTDGTATLSGFNNGTVVSEPFEADIPDTITHDGQTYKVTSIAPYAFWQQNNLIKVVMPKYLITIQDNAFIYHADLQQVDFSKATNLTTIGDQAFFSSGPTDGINLPDSVTTIGNSAFASSQAKSIHFPAKLETIGKQAFASWQGTDPITLPDSLTSLGDGAFIYSKISGVTLPANLKSTGSQTFFSNPNLTKVVLNSNLTQIGSEAFAYDAKLTDVNWQDATSLKTIGDNAFTFDGLNGAVTFPDTLQTIGNQAFLGNKLTAVDFGQNLKTIGDGAFTYNSISNPLVIPASVQSIGSLAFLGNHLTQVSINGTPTVATDSFSYNRITKYAASNATISSGAVQHQTATAFDDSPTLSINSLFNVNFTGTTQSKIAISNLTNNVTYHQDSGTFTIPEATNQFEFDWTLTAANGQVYTGHYTVVHEIPDIRAFNSQIYVGSSWTAQDNFNGATINGKDLELGEGGIQYKVTNAATNEPVDTVDTSKAGKFNVTYSYGTSASRTVTVEALPKASVIYTLSGTQEATYNDTVQSLDISKYSLKLSNGTTFTLENGDIAAKEGNLKDAGTYQIVLTQSGLTRLENAVGSGASITGGSSATFTITPKTVTPTLTGNEAVAYDGNAHKPTAGHYTISLDNGEDYSLKDSDIQIVNQPDGVTQSGTYDVTLSQSGKTDIQKQIGANYQLANVDTKAVFTINKAADAKTVTVRYVDESGKEIHKPQIITGKVGESYDTTTKTYQISMDGYTLNQAKLPTNAKGKLSDKEQTVTYVYTKNTTPSTPSGDTGTATPTPTPGSGSESGSSSSSSSTSSSSDSALESSTPSTSTQQKPLLIAKKGAAVYSLKKIGLYSSKNFSDKARKTWYVSKPRIYRPMFVVTGYTRSSTGKLRYKVRDVNHLTKNRNKTGYITANWQYVRPVYYAAKHTTFTVINPRGVNAYRKVNLTGKVTNYKQGTVLKVKGITHHNLTTRYILSNGQYITGNRKLVQMGRHKQVKTVRAKGAINRYRDVNLSHRSQHYSKKQQKVFKVYGFDYSRGNSVTKHGTLRYRVAGGYITGNAKYVRIIDSK